MFRPTLLISSAALALLVGASIPAIAQTSGGGSGGSLHTEQDTCVSLMDQFNAAKTDNAKAIALAKKGWEDCCGCSEAKISDGVDQLTEALEMINVKPNPDY